MGYPNPPVERPAALPMDGIDPVWLDSSPSELELKFAQLWVTVAPQLDLYAEAQLIPKRRFRFDFAHYPSMVAIEIQGYGAGHYSKPGVDRDNLKHRLAAEQGWVVLPIESGKVECQIEHNRIVSIIGQRTLQLKGVAA